MVKRVNVVKVEKSMRYENNNVINEDVSKVENKIVRHSGLVPESYSAQLERDRGINPR
jgi:hypothetical protein